MQPVLIGYFPKRTVHRPEWLKAAPIDEVCSVSGCISGGAGGMDRRVAAQRLLGVRHT